MLPRLFLYNTFRLLTNLIFFSLYSLVENYRLEHAKKVQRTTKQVRNYLKKSFVELSTLIEN